MTDIAKMMEPLNLARKIIGWANTAVAASPTNAMNALTRLDRAFDDKTVLPTARDVLRQLAGGVLPQQSVCIAGFDEVQGMRNTVKQAMENAMRQGEAEEDVSRPGI